MDFNLDPTWEFVTTVSIVAVLIKYYGFLIMLT